MASKPLCGGCGTCARCVRAAYMREWYRRPGNAQRQRESQLASRKRHIEAIRAYDRERGRRVYDKTKERARKLLCQKVRFGRLERQPCERCLAIDGTVTKSTHAHHEDYTRPYDVQWLCRKHHMELHRKVV